MQSFAERQVRDSASSVPGDYSPPDFTTVALQHTNVKLTWDADDDTRKKALRKKMTEDTIRDDDFKVSVLARTKQVWVCMHDVVLLSVDRLSIKLMNLVQTAGADMHCYDICTTFVVQLGLVLRVYAMLLGL